MRYIIVPEFVVLSDPFNSGAGTVKAKFGDFVVNLCNHESWGKGMDLCVRAGNLANKAKASSPGDLLEIEDQDYTLMKSAMEQMQYASPLMACQMVSFADAITSAPDTRPSEAKKARAA